MHLDLHFSGSLYLPVESLFLLLAALFTILQTDQKSTLAFLAASAWALALRLLRLQW